MNKNKRKRSESESSSSSVSGSDSDNEKPKKESSGLDSNTIPFTVILDLANLETVKTKKGEYQLLNCDDHIHLLKRPTGTLPSTDLILSIKR